ncbi:hypothetical protein GMORB2_5265 [Geosmithia morbida]|uniref:GST N-terminal domain-containing protein n=1 Tax=Geosmithia morbida TaxID=1094350 RepID=A0A9P4YZF4_9HYPO|nr:uncharacterized protein GMORB2_5265 [Geosmithia morbida]KAF4124599.1 hypothetical protein GMORB2_5265 [Geosmithia morbida]
MGQVPALRLSENRDGNEPTRLLADSSEILAWLCRLQPELIPKDHQEDIQSLLSSFYAFHAKPLTVKPEERNNGITNKAAAMLERTDISESHRRRLEVKSVYHDTKFRTTLDADNIETVESQARDFIRSVSDLLRRRQRQQQQQGDEDFSGSAIYIFGTRPSVADAVVTALLARLMDVGRDDIVDDETARDYTTKVISSSEWQKVMQGRRTLP